MKYLFIILTLFVLVNCYGQKTSEEGPKPPTMQPHLPCGMHALFHEEEMELEKALKKVANNPLKNNVLTGVPLKIHIVRETNGTGGLNMEDLLIGMANANADFHDAGIEFYICGDIDYIDDSDFFDFNNGQEAALAATAEEDSSALNLYIPNSIKFFGSHVGGYAYLPTPGSDNIQTTRLFVRRNSFTFGHTLQHELGHSFTLYHPFKGTESGNNHPDAEHVPRTGANSNCLTAGDFLCDTPADPRYDQDDPQDPDDSYNFIDATCTYLPGQMDIFGNLYDPQIENIMSYYPDWCGSVFTPDQYDRIGNGYALRLTHTSYSLDCPPAMVSAASNLTAIQNGNAIDLNWTDNANNELGYLIERSSVSATDGFRVLHGAGVVPDSIYYEDLTADSQSDIGTE